MDCVIKTALNNNKRIVWQALYQYGKKQIESVKLDKDILFNIFNNGDTEHQEIILHEDDLYNVETLFTDEEDFSYLLDNRDVSIGDTIYLEDGKHTVKSISKGYRQEGDYDYVEWNNGVPLLTKINYKSHETTLIKVEKYKRTIVWEDYSYQQSNLYEKFIQRTSKDKQNKI